MNDPILLIGSGRNVGQALAARLLAAGHSVFLTHRTEDAPSRALERDFPTQVLGNFALDVREPGALNALFFEIERAGRGLAAVVDSVGPLCEEPLATLSGTAFADLVSTNLLQAFDVARLARPFFLERGGGRLVYFTHAGAEKLAAYERIAAYAAAKAGLLSLVRSLARQWIKDGITVNAIAPGVVESAEAAQHELLPHLGGARLTTHDDLYAALAYLLADEAGAVTGLNLTVSAGVGL